MNASRLHEYDDLNSLFFQVLARRHDQRNDDVKIPFEKVPYLNSSLFEPTDLEHTTILISNLKDEKTIPVLSSTVLTDGTGKKRSGSLTTLQYLFEFLDAYDFSSEGSEDIQEDNKTLINASVLGLIFEKINGYKDGSFFTPGFITMYMCRETIRRAVVQKFNDAKGWTCESIESLYDQIEDRAEANAIVNSLRICDPAVGSGHFLVSALNELIAIKHDLRILCDRSGKRLKEYQFEVVNDELIVTDEDGRLFEYHRHSAESQRVQETLFHEKQTIIENCLFGVDINPNSVKICRLRLWIELLKNAYYRNATELETLPNIDINIKCGNSLVSRFAIDADLGQALKKSKWNIESYRLAVDTYRNAKSKEEKREMEQLIASIKSDFRSEISLNDKLVVRYRKVSGELFGLTNQTLLFEQSKKEKAEWNKQVEKLAAEAKKLETEIEDIKNNKIFENAFEWRFEFPEVLDHDGNFVGFDVVIGNPPYFVFEFPEINEREIDYFKNEATYKFAIGGKLNAYKLFLALAPQIVKAGGLNSQIFQLSFLGDNQAKNLRKFYLTEQTLISIDAFPERDNEKKRVFEEAKMSVCILLARNQKSQNTDFKLKISYQKKISEETVLLSNEIISSIDSESLAIPILDLNSIELLKKVSNSSAKLGDFVKCYQGELNISTHREYFQDLKNESLLIKGVQVQKYFLTTNISQGKIEYVNKDKYLSVFNNPKSQHYLRKRIVMQGITGVNERFRIKATLAGPNVFCGHSCNYILVDKLDNDACLYLLGLLNSNLYNWIFKATSTNSNVNSYEIEELPFVKSGTDEIAKLVDQIMATKNVDTTQNIKPLVNKIDQLVYQLYGLTDEEIAIVEAAVK